MILSNVNVKNNKKYLISFIFYVLVTRYYEQIISAYYSE